VSRRLGAECCEFVDGALDGVALLVVLGVASRESSAHAAPAEVVGLLAGRLGNRGFDPASAQVVTASTVGLPADRSRPVARATW
jgi:hypothetical protein